MNQHCCALTHRADEYRIGISGNGSNKHSGYYLNNGLHSVLSGLWVLALGRRADNELGWPTPELIYKIHHPRSEVTH